MKYNSGKCEKDGESYKLAIATGEKKNPNELSEMSQFFNP